MQFSNLISYAAYAIKNVKNGSVYCFFQVILQGIADFLGDAGIKTESTNRSYTPYTVDHFWKQHDLEGYYSFRSQITNYYLRALDSCLEAIELRGFIKTSIAHIWSVNRNSESFLISDEIDFTNQYDTNEPINQFISDSGIVVNVGTVHSVKGETHAATLYLETDYYGKTDAQRLINFLKGKRISSELQKKRHIYTLKIAHVAFSRPKYLLAFACRASNVDEHNRELENNGWEIHSVSELIRDREEV
jgi:vacuolar-type H+-ATPase subunit I/STV1